MKRCNSCGQILSQKVTTCPACGSAVMKGLSRIDDYRITKIIHEGYSTMVCKALKEDGKVPVSIRLFTERSGVDEKIAQRLEKELIELQKLPAEHFVQHFVLKKSADGLWYRISEWVDAASWGEIFVSGVLSDQRKMVTLFYNIASVLELLHRHDHFMPYLILDDILIPKKQLQNLHVKINYKLSRFLNARATHHGPMLQKLLDCHPDIINKQAIDVKSAIWSLGKVFVELLTANPNLTHHSDQVDRIKGLPHELGVLIKIMLSDDPDLRPQSMRRVVESLSKIRDRLPYPEATTPPTRRKIRLITEIKRLKTLTAGLSFAVLILAVALGSFSWFYFKKKGPDNTVIPNEIIDKYTSSVGFLMVEYQLYDEENVIYKNKVEGTAFLVDPTGYLMTNRHVACPWLEDPLLFQAFAQHSLLKRTVGFEYRMFLWFEGEKAFKRLPGLSDSADLSDVYYLESAFSSNGKGNLRLIGVPRSSVTTGERIKSPFKNDYAILKIDNPPAELIPLPLADYAEADKVQRLSPVIILGFPLGNRTQYDTINTSITRGHVRRTTKEIIQVDSSIYMGNSGGPAIDSRGQVIGIASGVITDQGSGYFNLKTPLSDFGLILPIKRPARFLSAIKAGHPHWDGTLDFSIENKLEQITQLALENKFDEAAQLTLEMMQTSKEPLLLYAAGMLHFCTKDLNRSKYFFKKLVMIEQENTSARLMLYAIDWILGSDQLTSLTKPLFSMEWHEENEFLGFLAQTLKNESRYSPDFYDWENRSQKSWRLFIESLILEKNGQHAQAQDRLKESILNAGSDDWIYFLSFSRLNQIHKHMTAHLEHPEIADKELALFREKAMEERNISKAVRLEMATMIQQFESNDVDHEQKVKIYNELIQTAPENRTIIGRVAFYHATRGEWELAMDFIDRYFEKTGRETALSLSLGLLKGELLYMMGNKKQALDFLKQFSEHTRDPWYSIIMKHLLKNGAPGDLVKLAAKKPEKLITLHTALGLWAEASDERAEAIQHYREALSSYLDEWNEYELALGRIIYYRQTSN